MIFSGALPKSARRFTIIGIAALIEPSSWHFHIFGFELAPRSHLSGIFASRAKDGFKRGLRTGTLEPLARFVPAHRAFTFWIGLFELKEPFFLGFLFLAFRAKRG